VQGAVYESDARISKKKKLSVKKPSSNHHDRCFNYHGQVSEIHPWGNDDNLFNIMDCFILITTNDCFWVAGCGSP